MKDLRGGIERKSGENAEDESGYKSLILSERHYFSILRVILLYCNANVTFFSAATTLKKCGKKGNETTDGAFPAKCKVLLISCLAKLSLDTESSPLTSPKSCHIKLN